MGLPIDGDLRKLHFLYPLIARIRSRLSGWKSGNLSLWGTCDSSQVCFALHTSLCSFLCQVAPISWIKWDTLCLERENGGLGKEFNLSLLDKWVGGCWRKERVFGIKCYVWGMMRKKRGYVLGNVEDQCSMWWQTLNKIRVEVGMLYEGWLLDNIHREVEDESFTLFWRDPWLDGSSLDLRFRRLFELADNIGNSCGYAFLGWGVNGEAWKWCKRLFALDKELVGGCVDQLTYVVLHVDVADLWVWKFILINGILSQVIITTWLWWK